MKFVIYEVEEYNTGRTRIKISKKSLVTGLHSSSKLFDKLQYIY